MAATAPPPAQAHDSQFERDARSAKSARASLDAGRPAEAAATLEALVAARHHLLPIRPEWHLDLGRAYAALGLNEGAQGQYRLAISAVGEQDELGVEQELDDLIAQSGRASLVPDTLGPQGAKFFDLHWIDRGDDKIDYVAAFVLPEDGPRGEAFMTAIYRADCAAFKTRLLRGAEFTATGETLRTFRPDAFASPGNDLASHALQMICRRDPTLRALHARNVDGVALLASYREQRGSRGEWQRSERIGKSLDPAACRAHVELFVERIAADGPVSAPTWQVRDWWDVQTEDLPAERMEVARRAAAVLERTDPEGAHALQSACVQEAIANDAVPGL